MTGARWAWRLCGWLLLVVATGAAAASRGFNITAGPATRGVTQFAQQAGLTVLFPYELLEGRRTRALRGNHEIEDGLRLLLRGTGLEGRIERGQISIRAAAPTASVPAPAYAEAETSEPAGHAFTDELPEAAVTGTRLALDGMTTPTPVAMLSGSELELRDPASLINALAQLPHFLNNDTPQSQSFGTSGAAGASYLNLRGIGSIRTLTLLDGRRIVPSTRMGTVDIALLPRNLLRRVEVVTGGASAAYGSDAVSGVVNLILNEDFRGFNGHAQSGISELGEYGNIEAGATFGTNIGERSSLLLSGEVFRADGIRGYAGRDWFDSSAAISNPNAGGPREIIAPHVHATGYTYGGLIIGGPLAGTQFLAGGVPAPFEAGALRTDVTQSGGSGVDPAADQVWMLPDQRRLNGFARFTTELAPDTTGWLQLLAGHSENRFGKAPPSLWGPWAATIYRDNAFLPESVRARMEAANIGSFRMGRVGSNGDLGDGMVTLTGELLSATLGLEKQFGAWSASGYYQFGRDLSRLRYDQALRLDRVYRAMDTVVAGGRIVCRSTLSFPDDGCVPLNPFGPGSTSPEARAWITEGSSATTQDMREHTAEGSLRGSVNGLPAGPISIVAGGTWRRESVDAYTRRHPAELTGLRVEPAATQGYKGLPSSYSGNENIFESSVNFNLQGSYSVWEAFGEALILLLRDRPLLQRLDLHAALRESRYSGSGWIPAWKIGLDWQLTPALRLRATRSRDVRAGSLSERYDTAAGATTIFDWDIPAAPVYAVISRREGNPAIDPEKSNTTTAGLVVRPGWAPGLSLSADYYDIRIRDAISTWGAQSIINGCAFGTAMACDLIDRDEETGLITRVRNRVLNLEQARARGIDMELSWRGTLHWLGGDSVAMRLFANRALESSSTTGNGTYFDRAGQTGLFGGAPRLQANLSIAWARGPVQVSVSERYISSGSYSFGYDASDIDRPRVRSAAYTALQVGWEPAAGSGLRLYLNVQNLFDQDPPVAPDWGFGGSIPTNEGLFDVLGRRYVAGVRFTR